MNLRFLSLASGSSGNCYYLGNDEYGILIDAGIGKDILGGYESGILQPYFSIIAVTISSAV